MDDVGLAVAPRECVPYPWGVEPSYWGDSLSLFIGVVNKRVLLCTVILETSGSAMFLTVSGKLFASEGAMVRGDSESERLAVLNPRFYGPGSRDMGVTMTLVQGPHPVLVVGLRGLAQAAIVTLSGWTLAGWQHMKLPNFRIRSAAAPAHEVQHDGGLELAILCTSHGRPGVSLFPKRPVGHMCWAQTSIRVVEAASESPTWAHVWFPRGGGPGAEPKCGDWAAFQEEFPVAKGFAPGLIHRVGCADLRSPQAVVLKYSPRGEHRFWLQGKKGTLKRHSQPISALFYTWLLSAAKNNR